MATTSVIDHTIKQGGSFSHLFTAKDCDGVVLVLTGATIVSKARFRDAPSIESKVTLTVDNTDLPNGQFTVSLTGGQTSAMKKGVWEFDATITIGSTILTLETRTLELLELISS